MFEYMLACVSLSFSFARVCTLKHTVRWTVIAQNNPNKFYKYLASNLPMSRWATLSIIWLCAMQKSVRFFCRSTALALIFLFNCCCCVLCLCVCVCGPTNPVGNGRTSKSAGLRRFETDFVFVSNFVCQKRKNGKM